MFRKLVHRIKSFKLSLRAKLTLSLCAIAVALLVSCVISILEYSRKSDYVSELIAEDIKRINLARQLGEERNAYHLDILAVVGEESIGRLPHFDQQAFINHCDSLKMSLTSIGARQLADSVVNTYSAYMLTSLELRNVLLSDFIDTRSWYFQRLQPRFNRLASDIEALNNAVYQDLKQNSETFQQGFYRSIIPGMVAVGVGLLLILMLLFFLLVYYVNPLYKMLSGLDHYRAYNKKYNYDFEGDDQLKELNAGIRQLVGENQQLQKRLSDLRDKQSANKTNSGT